MRTVWVGVLLLASAAAVAPMATATCSTLGIVGTTCVNGTSVTSTDGAVGVYASAESGLTVQESAGAGTMGTGASQSVETPIGAYLTSATANGPTSAIFGYRFLTPDMQADVMIYHAEIDNRYYSLCGNAPTMIAGQQQICIPYLI